MMFDEKIQGFVALIDRLLVIAQGRLKLRAQGFADTAPPGALEYMVNALLQYRDKALSGKLPPSEGVVTIGFLKEVADWGGESDSPLFNAAKDLERYYLEKMK
jgi:hypothetical protein